MNKEHQMQLHGNINVSMPFFECLPDLNGMSFLLPASLVTSEEIHQVVNLYLQHLYIVK